MNLWLLKNLFYLCGNLIFVETLLWFCFCFCEINFCRFFTVNYGNLWIFKSKCVKTKLKFESMLWHRLVWSDPPVYPARYIYQTRPGPLAILIIIINLLITKIWHKGKGISFFGSVSSLVEHLFVLLHR